jgi:hypothetical protein
MYSSQNQSSSTARPKPPLRSEALRADPTARPYLITGAGQQFLGTLADARQWFPLGYDISDPVTRARVDIGASTIPAFAEDPRAFGNQQAEQSATRERLAGAGAAQGKCPLSWRLLHVELIAGDQK